VNSILFVFGFGGLAGNTESWTIKWVWVDTCSSRVCIWENINAKLSVDGENYLPWRKIVEVHAKNKEKMILDQPSSRAGDRW